MRLLASIYSPPVRNFECLILLNRNFAPSSALYKRQDVKKEFADEIFIFFVFFLSCVFRVFLLNSHVPQKKAKNPKKD